MLFPNIRKLAQWAVQLETAGADLPDDIVWSDHLDLLGDIGAQDDAVEAGAMQEIMAIASASLSLQTGSSPSATDRMLNTLGDIATATVRHGDPEDNRPVKALWRTFVSVSPVD